MTTHPIHRTMHLTVCSAFLALAVFSFLVFGSGSAHAMTRQAAASAASMVSVSIVTDQNEFVFRPSAITIAPGTAVRITNKTTLEQEVRTQSPQAFYNLMPGQSLTISPTQSEFVRVCGGRGGIMTITVS